MLNKLKLYSMDSKFNVGDKVRVVGYGHLIFGFENGRKTTTDICADLVGKEGTVKEVTETQGKIKYALDGLSKTAWYDEKQLEKVLLT